MSLVLAILSFFSAVFLPGAIVYRFCSSRVSISSLIIVSFPISLAFNFLLISLLSLLGIYTQTLLLITLCVEIVIFLYVFRKEILCGIETPKLSNDNSIAIIFFLGILLSLYVFNNLFKADIFYVWDAVVSWNRWATQWANGEFILNEGGYSQLYPMLLSMGYVLSQKISSFQAIGVAIYWYFAFVGIVCAVFLLLNNYSLKQSILGIFIATITYGVFFKMHNEFYVGYVDMPVAVMILISCLCLLKLSLESKDFLASKDSIKSLLDNQNFLIILGALAAGVSVELKQAGLFWSCFYILGLLYLRIFLHKKISLKIVFVAIGVILALSFSWIFIAIYKKLFLDQDATNIEYVMDGIYQGKGYLERLIAAMGNYKNMTILFLVSLVALRIKNSIFGFFAVAGFLYFLMWGCLLSYDLRNLQGGMPMMIIAFSAVVVYYAPLVVGVAKKIYTKIPLIFVCFVAIGLVVASFSQESILKSEYKRKMRLGDREANEMVLKTFENRGEKIVLTSNQLLAFVPEFDRKYYRLYHFGEHIKDGEFEKYAETFKHKNGSFYILLPNSEFKRYQSFLGNKVKIDSTNQYTLFEF